MKSKKFSKAHVLAAGGAMQIDKSDIEKAIGRTQFNRCSGDFNGTAVHSLYAGKMTVAGKQLIGIAGADRDDSQAVHVFDAAELGLVAATLKLSEGATPARSDT